MGVEYNEAIAVLLERISSRTWDRDIPDTAVDRARQAVRDRTTLHWVTHWSADQAARWSLGEIGARTSSIQSSNHSVVEKPGA